MSTEEVIESLQECKGEDAICACDSYPGIYDLVTTLCVFRSSRHGAVVTESDWEP